ncbi:MAG: hypothetical protein LBP30_01300 [Clostridiales Family XIII bacterium]|jgi:hypothetical protein|nr:hypothetical protein [Clostridiales Family XIII bacterium]
MIFSVESVFESVSLFALVLITFVIHGRFGKKPVLTPGIRVLSGIGVAIAIAFIVLIAAKLGSDANAFIASAAYALRIAFAAALAYPFVLFLIRPTLEATGSHDYIDLILIVLAIPVFALSLFLLFTPSAKGLSFFYAQVFFTVLAALNCLLIARIFGDGLKRKRGREKSKKTA